MTGLSIACVPLLRPIFRNIFPARFLSSYYGNSASQPISRPSRAIRLATLSKTQKATENDETSSTHQLADVESGLSDVGDFDGVPRPVDSREGVRTMISSPCHEYTDQNAAGIHVRRDMVVEVVATKR